MKRVSEFAGLYTRPAPIAILRTNCNCDNSQVAIGGALGLEKLSPQPKAGFYVSRFWINCSWDRSGLPVTTDS
jgi:hypothetical protein